MRMKIQNNNDFCSGILFIFFGSVAIIVARDYRMGTIANMGPGYFPTALGCIITVLGLVIMGRAFWNNGQSMKSFAFYPLIFVLAAMVAFALLMRPLGLVLATLVLVITSSLGCRNFRVGEIIILYVVLVLLSVGIFVYGVGMPITLWPT